MTTMLPPPPEVLESLHETRIQVAHHEAGHALAVFGLGLTVADATINWVSSRRLFGTSWAVAGIVNAIEAETPLEDLLVAAAGMEAEALWTSGGSVRSRRRQAVSGNPDDARRVRRAARTTGVPAAEAHDWANELLLSQWGAVEAMADALLEYGHVSGSYLARLL